MWVQREEAWGLGVEMGTVELAEEKRYSDEQGELKGKVGGLKTRNWDSVRSPGLGVGNGLLEMGCLGAEPSMVGLGCY